MQSELENAYGECDHKHCICAPVVKVPHANGAKKRKVIEETCGGCGKVDWEFHWHEGRLCATCHPDLFLGPKRR